MNGIVLINKEKNCTSHDVVNKVKKITNSKVGHTGTLDPMATGVLPLLLGEGTKISKYLINHDKEYEVVLQLGTKTETADEEGRIIEQKNVDTKIIQEENVRKTLNTFIGKSKQIPPMYSAIKVNGKKLYEYARQGKQVNVEPRDIEIYQIELLKTNEKNFQIEYRVKCSKGTYIRSLCENIAESLGTIGYMKELNRTVVGNFRLAQAITISEFEDKITREDYSNIISIEEIFKTNEKINLPDEYMKPYINGVKIPICNLETNIKGSIFRIYNNNKFIGIGVKEQEKLKRDLLIKE